jgi:excisionase family DNA binding protein
VHSQSLNSRTQSADELASALALRPREAAKALDISERLLWQWTHDGDIPHVRIGRTILYPVDALRSWLNRKAATSQGGQQ